MVDPPLVSSEELFVAKGWSLRKDVAALPEGSAKAQKKAVRVYNHDRVHIIALPTDDTVLVIREYRPFYGLYVWMLPTGGVDKETDPQAAAFRELREETGYAAKECIPFGFSRHAESIVLTSHYFIARGLQKDPLPQDATEVIECFSLPIDEAVGRILTSPVVHTPSAYGILRFVREHRK